MPYNNNRSSNTRTVSYSGGGLNERFSKISQSASRTTTTTVTRSSGPSGPSNTQQQPSNSSVFSRLRGAKPVNKSIQNRLGKTIGGGIKKKSSSKNSGPTPMAGVLRGNGGAPRHKRVMASAKGGKKQIGGSGKKVTGKKQGQQKKKPATTEELDRALDNYMMKDPKTAQAKLDADMNAYMAEIEDINMDDAL